MSFHLQEMKERKGSVLLVDKELLQLRQHLEFAEKARAKITCIHIPASSAGMRGVRDNSSERYPSRKMASYFHFKSLQNDLLSFYQIEHKDNDLEELNRLFA